MRTRTDATKHARVAPLLVLMLFGCSLFENEKMCVQGMSSCDGDRVRQCVQDVEASLDRGELVTRWSTMMTCTDDPELGPYSCSEVEGRATCVPEPPADAGTSVVMPGGPAPWVRVAAEVTGDSVRIGETLTVDLPRPPPKAAAGGVAAVTYRDGEIVDATLIPLEPGQQIGHGWVNGQTVDQVALVDATGAVLSSSPIMPSSAAGGEAGEMHEGAADDALVSPSSSSVDAAAQPGSTSADDVGDAGASVSSDGSAGSTGTSDPSAVSLRDGGAVADVATAGLRAIRIVARYGSRELPVAPFLHDLMRSALVRVPDALLVLCPTAVLRLDRATAQLLAGGEVLAPTVEEVFGESPQTGAQWDSMSQQLFIGLGERALATYRANPLELARDIVRALAGAYVRYTSTLARHESDVHQIFGSKLPADFPPQLAPFLRAQYAALLALDESPVSAWEALHGLASSVQLARPYQQTFGPAPTTDEEAVSFGFAARAGSKSAPDDLTEYVVRAAVPELWTFGPCLALRQPLDELRTPLLVHVSKLLALRGLELLRPEAFVACVGELKMNGAAGIVLHTPNGQRATFVDETEGIRQPYYQSEVRLSWKARRKYMGVSLSAGYRGAMPSIFRLAPVGAQEGGEYGAIFATTNPDGYQTAVARGGLLVVTEASPEKLEAFALMVALSTEQIGTKVLPLISAHISKPSWEDEL